GEVRAGLFGFEMVHPRYRLVSPETPIPGHLTPVYPTSSSIPQHQLRKAILDELRQAQWRDTIPPGVLQAVGAGELPPIMQALREVHCPPADADPGDLLARRTPACR